MVEARNHATLPLLKVVIISPKQIKNQKLTKTWKNLLIPNHQSCIAAFYTVQHLHVLHTAQHKE
jgi:hypothetical protein